MSETDNRRRKPNSPRAPGISLKAALADVAKVYDRYSHGAFTRGELASALNMSGASGAFLGKSAALREYGLIADASPGRERVTELFKALYQSAPGTVEARRLAEQSVRHSRVFERLLHQFSARIPDVTAIALRLEGQERFNRDRARVVAAAFRSSLGEFGLIDSNGNLIPARHDDAEANDSSAELGEADSFEAQATGTFRVEVPLGPNRRAMLSLPDDMTSADVRRIASILAAFAEESS